RDGVDHGRPLDVAHTHRLGRVARAGGRGRDDDRDGLADVTHGIRRERIPRRLGERGAVAAPDAAAALGDQGRDGPDAVGDPVASGDHAEDAIEGLRGLRVDGRDLRVSVRRSDERRVRLSRRAAVLGVAPAPGEQAMILAALDRRADPVDPPWLRHTGTIFYPASAPASGTQPWDDQTEETSMSYDVKVEDIEYLRHGNTPYLLTLYRPQGTGPFPIMVELHGGAWCRSDRHGDKVI